LEKTPNNYVYTDEELMAKFQSGNQDAYIELVNRYKDRLINFVYPYLGDFDRSEDIVQDTMLKVYTKKHYYKEIAKFSTWIYTIAKNLANSDYRKTKRRKTKNFSQISKETEIPYLKSSDLDIALQYENEFNGNKINMAIEKLPKHFKSVIILRDIQEISYDEISLIMELPIGTVKSRINRARLQLRAELNNIINKGV
tara:strand:- start:1513 stop:2106 length:594 start_codon:yes stop_codon:yes gene_type:complete